LIPADASHDKLGDAKRWRSMPGLPCPIQRTSQNFGRQTSSFDRLLIDLMTKPPKRAVARADPELRHGSDPRLRIMAHAIRHEQQGEIVLMRGVDGRAAVSNAFRNMFADNVNSQRDGTLHRDTR
jgi:hypothetical protein